MGFNKIVTLSLLLIVVLSLLGCGGRSSRSLPVWAPPNPSEEFLRAAKTLTSPEEMFVTKYKDMLPSAWEFFGALDDQQIQDIKAGKELRLQYGSLNEKQKAALQKMLRSSLREADGSALPFDFLAELNKQGAAQDLSNVTVILNLAGGGTARLGLQVMQPDGSQGQILYLAAFGKI